MSSMLGLDFLWITTYTTIGHCGGCFPSDTVLKAIGQVLM